MGLIIINFLGLAYNLLMFWGEGGFNYLLSNRLIWIVALSFVFLLQLGLISMRNLAMMITGVRDRMLFMEQVPQRPQAITRFNARQPYQGTCEDDCDEDYGEY